MRQISKTLVSLHKMIITFIDMSHDEVKNTYFINTTVWKSYLYVCG